MYCWRYFSLNSSLCWLFEPVSCLDQDMINCVGGLPVLFPMLEQLVLMTPDPQTSDPTSGPDALSPDVTTPADGDWVILPTNRASGQFCCDISETPSS